MRYVVDASVAVELLLRTPVGRSAEAVLEDAELLAPALLDAEVLATLRRALLAGRLGERRARQALEDLGDWDVVRISHTGLRDEAWKLRHRVSGYDAFYVATARLLAAELLTADGPLARAPGLGIVVHNLRVSR